MKRTTPMKRTGFARPQATEPKAAKAPKDRECSAPNCEARFVPKRMEHVVCSPKCLIAKRKADEKAERENTKARKEALKSIAKLIAEAQVEFNAFIRARDKGLTCFVCDRPFDAAIPGRAMHAGHVRSRGAAGHLRFTEDNCMGECEGCNGPRGAKPHQIEAGAVRRIGQDRFDALKNDNTPRKWQRDDLVAIKNEYRAKRKELEKGQT